MSTKGLRHHMVMHSHHHRWATRRTASAIGKLSKSDAAAVPVQNGRRIKKQPKHSSSSGSTPHQFPPQPPPPQQPESRGSFDAFFSAQFGGAGAGATTAAAIGGDDNGTTTPTTTLYPNSYYSPHLFIPNHQSTTQKFNYSIDPTAGGAFPFLPPTTEVDLRPVHPYFADLGLPCGSVHNTLSHLFAAEKLWQHRWQNQIPSPELTALWAPEYSASGSQWSDYCSKQLGLPIINLDDEAGQKQQQRQGNDYETHHLLDMNLAQQHDLAQMVMSKLSLQLDSQNTDWISLIQGTSEPDLFAEVSYFGTDYTPSRLLTPSPSPSSPSQSPHQPALATITNEDFITDKAKLTSMQRLTILTHLFMHATHHRSQMLTVTSQFTGDQTVVDLSAFVPEWKQIHSKVFRWA